MPNIRRLPILSVILALLAVGSGGQCAEIGSDFRISGIMQLGANSFRALIEHSNGEKTTVRSGDVLDGWNVVSISDNCITLSLNANTQEKCLMGSADKQAPAKATATSQTAQAQSNGQSHLKKVDRVDLLQALDRSAQLKNMSEVSENILPLVATQAEQQITQIDARDVTSVQNAIASMRKSVDENRPIRLTLTNQDKQPNVIYILADPQVTNP